MEQDSINKADTRRVSNNEGEIVYKLCIQEHVCFLQDMKSQSLGLREMEGPLTNCPGELPVKNTISENNPTLIKSGSTGGPFRTSTMV
jgi:hypothetical protein